MAGINFRNTSGYVTDGAGETYSLGEAYPTTRGGLTFGFASSLAANSRNRDSGVDRRLAGCVFQVNSAGTMDFTLDLPNGPGEYTVRLALGDAGNAQNHKCLIKDTTTLLATVEADTTVGQFLDANGTVFFSGTWAAGNVAQTLTFGTSKLVLTIGGDSSGTLSTALAHLFVATTATGSTASPGAGSAAFSGQAPTATVSSSGAAQPGAGAAVIAGQAPTAVRTTNVLAQPAAGAIVTTGRAPSIARTGSFITEALINNTGTVRSSEDVAWSWYAGGRVGALDAVTALDGSGTTEADGTLIVPGLTLGSGLLLVAQRNTDATDDDVYYEAGAVN